MDSRDKQLTDLKKLNQDLKVALSAKNQELATTKNALSEMQNSAAGIEATRKALADERELSKILSDNLQTRVRQIEALNSEIQTLKDYNLSLQAELNNIKTVKENG